MNKILPPETWGLRVDADNMLCIDSIRLVDLAKEFGTPLHVVNKERLEHTARSFVSTVKKIYPGKSSVHYACKCNSVSGVVKIIRSAGLKAEVMSIFELKLALLLGYSGNDIIVNGPYKTDELLRFCIENTVRLIIVDSITELHTLNRIADESGSEVGVLLRLNPDITPKGMNSGSATGSRKGSPFGLDVKGGEAIRALELLPQMRRLRFCGYHFHIGTGIRYPEDYKRTLRSLRSLFGETKRRGFDIQIIDTGGGIASMTTRELTAKELLLYQGFNRFPNNSGERRTIALDSFIGTITEGIQELFSPAELPELILEPGRCIASPNQLLLLTVHRVKNRPGVGTWFITDGGLGTVTMPTYYEYHEVFLCNDVYRPRNKKVTIAGPGCFAADIVYKNKRMPESYPGEVLAIMDSGAYFTALESSFGYPRPAIVSVSHDRVQLMRKRETFHDMIHCDKVVEQCTQ